MSFPWLERLCPVLALLALTLLLAAPAAHAACPDESGIGGTGVRGDDESGVGGTGLSDDDESGLGGTGVEGDDDESGVGGTGVRTAGGTSDDGSGVGGTGLIDGESGVGGTGLIGTITAYGSVCVNGFSVEYDDATAIEENGSEARASDLEIGAVVVVDAESRDGGLRARRIAVRQAAMGPAGRIDPDTRTLEVVGQTVEVPRGARVVDRIRGDAQAELADWAPGEYLAVSGLRESNGRIVASRVERRAPRDEVSVTGRLETRDDGLTRVGGAAVALARDDVADRSEPLLVRGRWNAREARIEGARSQRAYRFDEGTDRVSLEGYVQEIDDDGRGRVAGLPVVIARDARGDRSPARGERVRMSGRLDRDGRLRAREVRVDRGWRERLDREERRDRRDRRDRRERRGAAGRRDRDDDDRDEDERDRDERDRDERDRDERDRDDRDRDERDRDRDDRGDDDDDRDRDERDRDDGDRDDRDEPDDDDD